MPRLIVLSVFTDVRGEYGNKLGIVPDGAAVPENQRQALAARLGFSETVFVNDLSGPDCGCTRRSPNSHTRDTH